MKLIFYFMLLFVLSVELRAQCACCVSPSGFSPIGSNLSVVSIRKHQAIIEAYGDSRFYAGLYRASGSEKVNDTSLLRIHTVETGILGLRYGINNKIAIMFQQPYFRINTGKNNSYGFGDMISLLNFAVISRKNMYLGVQAGLEWPLGTNSHLPNGNTISSGSGSYDPLCGIAVSRIMKRAVLNANAFLKYTTKGYDNISYGNIFNHQVGYNYKLTKDAICVDSSSNMMNVFVSLLYSGEWSQAQMQDHVFISNTGGYQTVISAGLMFSYKGFSIPVYVGMPFYRNFNGTQNYEALRFRIGLVKTLNKL